MPTGADIAKRYFQALAEHDLDTAAECWAPGAVDRLVGQEDLVAPAGIREYFGALFAAFPDFSLEILEMTTDGERTAVRWQARGTFAGPGKFQGFEPNGAQVEIEGCDVVTVENELIAHNDAYIDAGDIARQLGFLPPGGSPAEARLTTLANLRTKLRASLSGSGPEQIADGSGWSGAASRRG
jgi:predicted ester cyclase